MMKVKVYLDTSVISALFDGRNPDRQFETKRFFESLENLDVFASAITVAEIRGTADPEQRAAMLEFLANFEVLPITEEARQLGNEYLKGGAIPPASANDAYQIAIAVLNEMDVVLSWNFKHIVRRRTKTTVQMINASKRLRSIDIMSPPELS
jgi:predicted nucleic acid-binding protein